LIYYFITDISGTTVPIFRVAMNGQNSNIYIYIYTHLEFKRHQHKIQLKMKYFKNMQIILKPNQQM